MEPLLHNNVTSSLMKSEIFDSFVDYRVTRNLNNDISKKAPVMELILIRVTGKGCLCATKASCSHEYGVRIVRAVLL